MQASSSSVAVSKQVATILVVIIVGVIAAAYFVSGAYPSVAPTSTTTSQSQSSSANQLMTSSTFLGSSSSVVSISSSSTTVQSVAVNQSTTVQPVSSSSNSSSSSTTNQSSSSSTIQYPLVWQSTSPTFCDFQSFCMVATLGFSGQTATTNDTSTTTITGSNGTTMIYQSITTIIRTSPYPQTTEIEHAGNASYPVIVTAFVQDAVTGQNITVSDIAEGCSIQPTGFTHCITAGILPSGHTYNVTLYVTKDGLPCPLVGNSPGCEQLLAPPSQTITITE